MNTDRSAAEDRAFQVAHRDFVSRVTWADTYRVTVTTERGGYVVDFLRQLAAGEPMIRGGGIENGITYHIGKTFAIERYTLPR